MATHGVDLVDEDDAGRVLLALLEQIAHAARAHADEHLDEVRARDAEERDPGLARDRPGEERLARAGRTDEEHALRNSTAKSLKLLWILEKRDDLLDLVLGLVDPGDVRERHLVLRVAQHPRLRLAEGHRLTAAGLKLTHEEEEHDADEEHREERHERGRPERRRVFLLEIDLEFPVLRERIVLEVLDQRLIRHGAERLDRAVLPVDDVRELVLVVLDAHIRDLTRVHPGHELAEADLLLPLARLQHLPDRQEHHDEQHPQQQSLVRLLHVDLVLPRQLAANGTAGTCRPVRPRQHVSYDA